VPELAILGQITVSVTRRSRYVHRGTRDDRIWIVASAWVAYALAFSVAGLGFGLGWTLVNIGTQDVVRPERAGESALLVMAVRQQLVRRGLMAPLSMKASWTPPAG